MTQKNFSIMDKIKHSHKFANLLPCMEFDYSINPYLGYWYAEDRLYILHDIMINAYFFEVANSPYDAIDRIRERFEDAAHAGEPHIEEVTQ